MNKENIMKLQVSLGECTVNTTPAGIRLIFQPQDAAIFSELVGLCLRLSGRQGQQISQRVHGIDYQIRVMAS